jgi:hypothetical protein
MVGIKKFLKFRQNLHESILKTIRHFLEHSTTRRSQTRMYTHSYERTHAHPTPMNTFEGPSWHILRLMKSPLTSRY